MVEEAGLAAGPVAAYPFGDRRERDVKALGGARLHPAVLDDQLREYAAPFEGQWSVGMGNPRNEGLHGTRSSVVTQSIPEVLTFFT